MPRKASAVLSAAAPSEGGVSLKDQMKAAKVLLKEKQAVAKATAKEIMGITKQIDKLEAQMLKAKPAPKAAAKAAA